MAKTFLMKSLYFRMFWMQTMKSSMYRIMCYVW
ncbi:hypothetical protein IMSAGC022_01487 [Alistipes sp.]|nr:hypothetical protein IMSAGC022_01487 [Alistipes sp.]